VKKSDDVDGKGDEEGGENPGKVEKEYALLSGGQLAVLRTLLLLQTLMNREEQRLDNSSQLSDP